MQQLFQKYLDNQCSPAEITALLAYFNDPGQEHELRKLILESLALQNNITAEDETRWNEMAAMTFQQIKRQIEAEKVAVIPFFKRTWFRVAAAVLLVVGAFTIYKLADTKNKTGKGLADIATTKQDVAPGGNKAVLKLADGTQIILDSAANGNIASQGKTRIIKLDGQLSYAASGNNAEVLYNTITTPRGGQYQLVLADGTKVWLNAASSLRFPATFSGKERRVELTGEGYFEVAKNAAMPFKVDVTGKEEVEVLGTHFNIMGYEDENSIKTTLVEGKVKIAKGGNVVFLLPNQQGIMVRSDNSLNVDKGADVNKAIAWKNGLFDFDDDDITDIMRQLSRWYDVDVQYMGNLTAQYYTGSIRRQVNISQVLYMLEQAGGVQFKIDRKKIIVRTK